MFSSTVDRHRQYANRTQVLWLKWLLSLIVTGIAVPFFHSAGNLFCFIDAFIILKNQLSANAMILQQQYFVLIFVSQTFFNNSFDFEATKFFPIDGIRFVIIVDRREWYEKVIDVSSTSQFFRNRDVGFSTKIIYTLSHSPCIAPRIYLWT